MNTTSKWLAIVAVAFVAGSFIASPELRAYAANSIGSIDIINESIQSVDIKNGQVKAADIATDAVGASEIDGVTKLIFSECAVPASTSLPHAGLVILTCSVAGTDSDDQAIASHNMDQCFSTAQVKPLTNQVRITLANSCNAQASTGTGKVSIIVYDAPTLIDPL